MKVNALLPVGPEKAAVTHPEVVRAVVQQIQKVTARITVGDSPGGPFNQSLLRRTYHKTGLYRVAEETGVSLNYDTTVTQKTLPAGKTMKSFSLCKAMIEVDRLISISKLKTHLFMNITCAIKNVFGTVPGMTKFTYHAMFHKEKDFADLLVDVLLAAEPDFHLIDAIVGMDGKGSLQGNTKKMGIIAAGKDPLALDTLMTHLVGLHPIVNLPLKAAIDRGLCSGDMSKIHIVGDDPRSLYVDEFQLPAVTNRSIINYLPDFFMRRYGNWMSLRPSPNPLICSGCRKCVEICPGEAISVTDKVAVVDLKKCTRCYCCVELCENSAVELKHPLFSRMMCKGK